MLDTIQGLDTTVLSGNAFQVFNIYRKYKFWSLSETIQNLGVIDECPRVYADPDDASE